MGWFHLFSESRKERANVIDVAVYLYLMCKA